jgi:hypothetical protein
MAAKLSHFTTLEEEEARRAAERDRPWLLVGAQLAGIVAVLGGLVAFAIYMSRPPSADDLYDTISSQLDGDADTPQLNIEDEVEKFLALYPDDERADEIERHKERLDLDKLERRLYRQVRENGTLDASLLPVEQLYVQSLDARQSAPDEAAAMLQSLIDLYQTAPQLESDRRPPRSAEGARKAWDDQVRTATVVQLAKRRLAALKDDLAWQRSRELESLRERMSAAQRLADSDPQQAAAMYRAIINLHERDKWADKIVAEARSRLTELDTTSQ